MKDETKYRVIAYAATISVILMILGLILLLTL